MILVALELREPAAQHIPILRFGSTNTELLDEYVLGMASKSLIHLLSDLTVLETGAR